MSTPASSPHTTQARIRFDGRSGALAALFVLFLDLLWRATIAPAGVSSIPESVVAAVARLTPLAIFAWATETFGSLAQNTLFALVLIGIVGAGYWAGQLASALVASGRFGTTVAGRLGAGFIMAGVLFLLIAAGVFPLAREGMFAAKSAYQGVLLLQAALFAVFWALPWAALGTAPRQAAGTESPYVSNGSNLSRRSAVRGVAAAGLAAGVTVLGWRLAKTPDVGDVAAQEETASEIAARARARAQTDVPAPESGESLAAQVATPEPVAAESEDVLDSASIFEELDAAGQLTPVITSVADFYHVSKNISDPVVEAEGWSLTVNGMVANPLNLSYDEVLSRVSTRNITTLGCISNELNGDLIGTAEWTGFPLRTLLEEAGVDPATVDIVFRAADGYDDSIPFPVAMDPNTLVVTGMNGEPLQPDHGYPARIIVPPIYGMKNVKWVEQIEAVDVDHIGYWQTRGWSDDARYHIWGRFDTPAQGESIVAGPATAAGVAFAGDRGILRVEISLDEGATWADATLEPSINPTFTWVRWVFPFEATPGVAEMRLRATDGEGMVAPEEFSPPPPDGATGWPLRAVQVVEG